MALLYAQLITIAVVLVGNFVSGTAPFFLLRALYRNDQNGCRKNKILTFLVYFGGGVFMSLSFLNLLPIAREEYEIHHHQCFSQHIHTDIVSTIEEDETHHEGFPIPEFIILCGFFMVYCVEELLLYIFTWYMSKPLEPTKKVPFCSCAKRHTECSRTFKADNPAEITLYGQEKNLGDSIKEPGFSEYIAIKRSNSVTANAESRLLQTSIIAQPIPNYGAVPDITQINPNQPDAIFAPPIVFDKEGKVAIAPTHSNQIDCKPYTTYLLLAITLCVYDICHGVSAGHLNVTFTWTHLIYCVQQFILSFVTGSLISQHTEESLTIVCYIGLISLMCPLGISVAMIFDTASMISHLFRAILSAIMCGSFLYLTFFDLVRVKSLHSAPSLGKFAFFSLGFSIIAAVQYVSIAT